MTAIPFPRRLAVLISSAVLGGAGLAVVAVPAHAAASATVVADAYVTSSRPKANFGAGKQVTVDAQPATYGYFRFAVTVPAGETVDQAVFRCWAGSSNASGAALRPVSSSWTERSITWANAPKPDLAVAPAAVTGSVVAGTWAAAEVTSLVKNSGTYSFALTTASATAWSCSSRESTGQHPPTLAVTTTAVTPPPPPPPPSPPPPQQHASLTLPARGTFYYPWFPEAWDQSGVNPATRYTPSAGYYSTTSMLAPHVQAMTYGGFAFAASSWWGQGSKEDVRFGPLLAAAHGTPLAVAPYYEAEGNAISGVAGSPNPSPTQLTGDLNYLAAHYVDDPNYLWIAGKPALFVYGDGSDSCATASRWASANAAAATRFYLVLKVFSGYQTCADQPDNWHQYAPAVEADGQGVHSYTISPGFYKFNEAAPRLARDPARWALDVRAMNCSTAAFKLVTTFNEWGEGSPVESATQWASSSGYGTYLDALHAQQNCPSP